MPGCCLSALGSFGLEPNRLSDVDVVWILVLLAITPILDDVEEKADALVAVRMMVARVASFVMVAIY